MSERDGYAEEADTISTGSRPRPSRTGRRRWPWLVLGGLVVVLGLGYVTAYALIGDRVPHGTRVAGVDIGGLAPDDAQARLEEQLTSRAGAPVAFVYDTRAYPLDPESAGLSFDAAATVRDAGGGRSWNPARMVDALTGPDRSVAPLARVDDDALTSAVADLAKTLDRPAQEGAIRLRGTRPQIDQPVVGRHLDQEQTREAAKQAYLGPAEAIPLPVVEREPALTGSELRTYVDADVTALLARPIVLALPGQRLILPVRDFGPALSWRVEDGRIRVRVDADVLERATRPALARIGSSPHNASLVLRDGRPVIVPARPGVTIRSAEVAAAVHQVAKDPSHRRIEVGTTVAQADVTTRDIIRLGVKERVSDFVTYFPYAEYRNINQGRAAELIDGSLVRPGDTFSFNDTVGERTKANGFTEGFIISNGVFAEELGGGVSQVVTTTYNAAFFAGMDDVTHTPHSFYIDRYPLGREATVAWPSVDLQFRNSTPYAVLVHAWVVPSTPTTSGEMHVQMFSTKYWDITAGVSDRYDFTSPAIRYDPSNSCVDNSGYGGFEVDVSRSFRRHGSRELAKKETDHVVYTPSDTVICSAPPR